MQDRHPATCCSTCAARVVARRRARLARAARDASALGRDLRRPAAVRARAAAGAQRAAAARGAAARLPGPLAAGRPRATCPPLPAQSFRDWWRSERGERRARGDPRPGPRGARRRPAGAGRAPSAPTGGTGALGGRARRAARRADRRLPRDGPPGPAARRPRRDRGDLPRARRAAARHPAGLPADWRPAGVELVEDARPRPVELDRARRRAHRLHARDRRDRHDRPRRGRRARAAAR